MSHTHIQFSTDNGKAWRELPDNENTDTYLTKLSHASNVLCMIDTGEWWEIECGVQVRTGTSNCPGYANTKFGR